MQHNILKKFNENHFLIFIFLFSFFARLTFALIFDEFSKNFFEDSKIYYDKAIIFFDNGFFNQNTHSRPPLLSLIIVPILYLSNQELILVLIKLLMITISSLTILIIYKICRNLNFDNLKSFYCSIMISIYPFSIFFSSRFLTENLAFLLMSIFSLFFIKFLNTQNIKFLIVSSFLLGLLSLCRSAFYYLPFFIIAYLCFFSFKLNFKSKVKISSLIIFIFFLTLSPWILKNYLVHDKFIPTTSRLGYGLWLSNNDFSNQVIKKGGYARTKKYKDIVDETKNMKPIKRSHYFKNKAINEITNNKVLFIKTLFYRLKNMLHFKPNPYLSYKITDFTMLIYWIPLYIGFFLSIFSSTRLELRFFFYTCITYILLVHLPFYGFPRFRFPVDFMIIIISFNYFYDKIKSSKYL